MRKMLIVVDMQNDFVTGTLRNEAAIAIIPNIVKKVEEYQKNKDMIFFTYDTHYENYLNTQEGKLLPIEHCICGTEGWQLIPELRNYYGLPILKKSFGYDGWKDIMNTHEIPFFSEKDMEVEVIGTCTDICVISNVLGLKAINPEMKITVDSSCCAGLTKEKHEAALEVMRSCQINVI